MRFNQISKLILGRSAPLLSARIANMAVFFVGFIMVARLGVVDFAACALATSVYVTVTIIAVGTVYGTGIKMGFALGQKEPQKIINYFQSGVLLSCVLFSLAAVVMGVIAMLLPYLGQKPEVIPLAQRYLCSFILPILPMLISVVFNQYFTVLGKPKVVLYTSMLNAVFTVLLTYLLVLSDMSPGAMGFGIAVTCGYLLSVLVLGICATRAAVANEPRPLCFAKWPILITGLKEIAKLGVPMGIQFGAEVAALSVVTFFMGSFALAAVAASQIAQQLSVLTMTVPFTVSEATSMTVGQAMGQKNTEMVKLAGHSSLVIVFIFTLIFSLGFLLFPKLFVGIYLNLNDSTLLETIILSCAFLRVIAVSQIFDAIRHTLSGALRGLGDAKYPMYVGIITVWCVGLPLGAYLVFQQNMGPIGFSVGLAIAYLLSSLTLQRRFSSQVVSADDRLAAQKVEANG